MHYDKKLGLGVWFRDEIRDTLLAVDIANLDIANSIDTSEMRLYRKGYEAAIRAVATAFGISYPLSRSQTKATSELKDINIIDVPAR